MNNIYNLVSIDKETRDEYVMAISYDHKVLENFMVHFSNKNFDFAIKDQIGIYEITYIQELQKNFLFPTTYDNSK